MGWIPTKARMAHIVYESNDKASKTFDIVLLIVILLSVAVVILDSGELINKRFGGLFYALEWFFTILFTLEYFFRIWLSNDKKGCPKSLSGNKLDSPCTSYLLKTNRLMERGEDSSAFSGLNTK
jgi:hypothetical protein